MTNIYQWGREIQKSFWHRGSAVMHWLLLSPEDSHRVVLWPPTHNHLVFILSTRFFFLQKNEIKLDPKHLNINDRSGDITSMQRNIPSHFFLMSRILLAGRCSFHCSPQEDTHLEIDSFDSIVPLAIIAFHWLRTLQHQDISLQCFAGCSLLCCCANRAEKSRTFP